MEYLSVTETAKKWGVSQVLIRKLCRQESGSIGIKNSLIGRLIMFKECLRHDVMPFIIDDKRRTDYLEGIRQWDQDRSILTDIVLDCQARFEAQIALQRLRESGAMFDLMEEENYEDE